jgi:hypothetical protein
MPYTFRDGGEVITDNASGYCIYFSFTISKTGLVTIDPQNNLAMVAILVDHGYDPKEASRTPKFDKDWGEYTIENLDYGILKIDKARLRRSFKFHYANELQHLHVLQLHSEKTEPAGWFELQGWKQGGGKPVSQGDMKTYENTVTFGDDINEEYAIATYTQHGRYEADEYAVPVSAAGSLKWLTENTALKMIPRIANTEEKIGQYELVVNGDEEEGTSFYNWFPDPGDTSWNVDAVDGFVMVAAGAFKQPRLNSRFFREVSRKKNNEFDDMCYKMEEWALSAAHDLGEPEKSDGSGGQNNLVRTFASAPDTVRFARYESVRGPMELIYFDSGQHPLPSS